MSILGLLTSHLSVAARPRVAVPGEARQEGNGRPDPSCAGLTAIKIRSFSGGHGMRTRIGEDDIVAEHLRMVYALRRPVDTFKEDAELVAGCNQGIRTWTVWDSLRYAGRSA
jgi:hypothetical protein